MEAKLNLSNPNAVTAELVRLDTELVIVKAERDALKKQLAYWIDEYKPQAEKIAEDYGRLAQERDTPKLITDRIKTVHDLLNWNSLSQEDFDRWCDGLEDDEIAYRLLKMLTRTLNEGWLPDWTDANQYKYVVWFDMRGGSSGFQFYVYDAWYSRSSVGSRLCFKSQELAEYASKQFIDLYRRFMIIE